jgi:hypothetical protein
LRFTAPCSFRCLSLSRRLNNWVQLVIWLWLTHFCFFFGM